MDERNILWLAVYMPYGGAQVLHTLEVVENIPDLTDTFFIGELLYSSSSVLAFIFIDRHMVVHLAFSLPSGLPQGGSLCCFFEVMNKLMGQSHILSHVCFLHGVDVVQAPGTVYQDIIHEFSSNLLV